jgi:putative Mg2+ transporter-C (MgtC) family protein
LAHAVGSQGAALGGIAQCVGFLGAGVIIHEGIQVRGLSTAANFWAVAAIGVANGTHEFAQALMLTLVVFSVHLILRPLSLWIDRKAPPGEDEPK